MDGREMVIHPRNELKSKLFHISGLVIPFIATVLGFWLTIIAGCVYILLLAIVRYHIMTGKRLLFGSGWLYTHLAATGHPERKRAEGKHPLVSSYLVALLIVFIFTWIWQQIPIFFVTVSVLAIHDGLSAVLGRMFGRHEFPYSHKTYEGTFYALAFSLPASIVMAYLGCELHGNVFFPGYLMIAIVGIVIGATIETVPIKNDNVVITLVSASVMSGVLWLLQTW